MTNLGDRRLGLLVAVVGIVIIYMSLQLPEPMSDTHIAYGPGFFPALLGVAAAVAGVTLAIVRPGAGQNEDEDAVAPAEAPRLGGPVLVLLAMLSYIYLSDLIGFIPLATATLTILLMFGGMRFPKAIALSLLASILVYLMFSKVLLVPLPRGLLQSWALWL
ncbi:tripartite tricarboxylate transporter TctB family protein [Agrobacterium deltaense]